METMTAAAIATVGIVAVGGLAVHQVRTMRRRHRRDSRRLRRRAYAFAWDAVFRRRLNKRLTYRAPDDGQV